MSRHRAARRPPREITLLLINALLGLLVLAVYVAMVVWL